MLPEEENTDDLALRQQMLGNIFDVIFALPDSDVWQDIKNFCTARRRAQPCRLLLILLPREWRNLAPFIFEEGSEQLLSFISLIFRERSISGGCHAGSTPWEGGDPSGLTAFENANHTES